MFAVNTSKKTSESCDGRGKAVLVAKSLLPQARGVCAHMHVQRVYSLELEYTSTVNGYSLGARQGVVKNQAATLTSDAAQ